MTIRLDGGAPRTCEYIGDSVVTPGRLMIEIEDTRALSVIAAEFEGVQRIDAVRWYDKEIPYEGYTELIDIRRNQADGSVRMTLKKPKEG